MIKEKLYTVQQAAEELELTTGRVRQICRWNQIGTKCGRDWLLTEQELQFMRNPENRQKQSA